ncbi:peptidylprolyl isomerase [Sediminicoccus rosea]|uniref:Parvulin-like PPIase n=1 Tax=Sediminicoccus rosea TaxID=1225128 RepID=A0ABZ0PQI4_9PROT|nr:SurA N-terminal domain-containing protein [Sediminicoccus rosea]WPB87533.1 SurA N-terminal domain-containing protein [Sediminicoccus rosea]
MITAMRRLAGTWFAKLLFVLLILSFAVWGIEDMLRNIGRDTAVARVGDDAIEVEEAQEAARRELQRIQRQLQGRMEMDARIRRAVAEQALEGLVLDRVLRQEQARMRIAVPDDVVRDYIFQIPGFAGLDGRFSREVFNNFLRSNEMTEARFLDLLRTDLGRQQLAGAVRAGAAAPEALGLRMLAWALERRTAMLVELPFAEAPEPEPPTEAQLVRYHENNARLFSTPEYRDVALATLNAARLMGEIEVSERDIEDGYAANRARYETPEKREVFQAVMQDEAAAQAIATAWRQAADFAAIEQAAQAAGGMATALGLSSRADLPLPALADAAFALTPGDVSAPVRTPFGWHVLRVGTVEAGAQRSLDEVRDELRAEIQAERAADLAFERVNRVEDALAGGASLAEAARRYSLGYVEARLDATGRAPDGTEVALPVAATVRPAVLRAIFAAERGAPPRLQEGEWGFIAMDVREITPPALRPLDTVREQVVAGFLADARRRWQEERAAALLAATRAGQTLAAAAEAAGIKAEELGPFPREPGGGNPMPRDLLAPVFELAPNATTMVERAQSFAVMQLLSVTPADLSGAGAALTALRSEAAQAMAEDFETQYQAALRARANVRINPRLIDQIAGN